MSAFTDAVGSIKTKARAEIKNIAMAEHKESLKGGPSFGKQVLRDAFGIVPGSPMLTAVGVGVTAVTVGPMLYHAYQNSRSGSRRVS